MQPSLNISSYQAGTTLYIPATSWNFMENVLEEKYPFLPSVTFCLEDAIRREDIPKGIGMIRKFLSDLPKIRKAPLIFIRPPDPEILADILKDDLAYVAGFVLPKFDLRSAAEWTRLLGGSHFLALPTLETSEVFDVASMVTLAGEVRKSAMNIPLCRIGGNDLQQLLGIGRDAAHTIYDGALGYTLGMLANIFISRGIPLSAPVYSMLDAGDILGKEIEKDVLHGFCGKSAVHPCQLETIRQGFAVTEEERCMGEAILNNGQPVFRYGNMMCEPVVQKRWAANIRERYRIFGTKKALQ